MKVESREKDGNFNSFYCLGFTCFMFRFTSMVHEVVSRGGRCLIPVFAVGPAQELMLILDEYWENHPELSEIPIYC
jgi:hypothetical protein